MYIESNRHTYLIYILWHNPIYYNTLYKIFLYTCRVCYHGNRLMWIGVYYCISDHVKANILLHVYHLQYGWQVSISFIRSSTSVGLNVCSRGRLGVSRCLKLIAGCLKLLILSLKSVQLFKINYKLVIVMVCCCVVAIK